MTYRRSGVNYDGLDALKRLAQSAARDTAGFCERLGVHMCEDTFGESVQLFRMGDCYVGHVNEGLGTKNLIADAMDDYCMPGTYYDSIAQDTVAMVVNDMITLGVLPFDIKMHLAVRDTSWMKERNRVERLVSGWRHACQRAGCTWSGGETPALKGIIKPKTALLSGSAIGKTIGLTRFSADQIKPGDAIVFFGSSGIHANGLTFARSIAEKLKDRYRTEVPGTNGWNFAHALLQPTIIYASAIEQLIRDGVEVHYGVNVTGHGWRKLMRAPQPLTYTIDHVPKPHPVFDFIQKHGNVSVAEMYSTFNMGVGFALFVPESSLKAAVPNSPIWPFRAWHAGYVESGEKQVVIPSKNLIFKGETLSIR